MTLTYDIRLPPHAALGCISYIQTGPDPQVGKYGLSLGLNRRLFREFVTYSSRFSVALEKYPKNTFIGRIEWGFDFLGYHLSPKGLTVTKETLKRFVSCAIRLYEQGAGSDGGCLYLKRWCTSRVDAHRWTAG
ncbi:MAG: hypothetical protein ABSH41_29705 [Syntrophobacteraceae bacterium]